MIIDVLVTSLVGDAIWTAERGLASGANDCIRYARWFHGLRGST